jgi:hypothetical protein
MATLEAVDLSAAVQALRQLSERALREQSADDLELVEQRINELDATVREWHQSLWASELKSAMRHLEGDQALSEPDAHAIRAFLICDAERYLKQENNFNEWVQELRRLLCEIENRLGTADRESIADLRGVIKDAVRLVPDIRNYLDERRRVALFEQGLKNLDAPARATLVRLLRDQLYSPHI